MTLKNPKATDSYLKALNDMPGTKPGELAALADHMSGSIWDGREMKGYQRPAPDAMMDIETQIFITLCDANGVNWRNLT